MENRINVAELLKDCPEGMELDCTMYENVTLKEVSNRNDKSFPIHIETKCGFTTRLTKYGQNVSIDDAKCVIFPKGKTTWEGFVPPCKFKDGDVIFTHANCLSVGLGNTWISIYKENRNGGVATYIDYAEDGSGCYSDLDGDKALLCMERDILRQRIATEEEKQKLFQAIKDKGYKWNAETKTLDKLVEPKFKVGDRIKKGEKIATIVRIYENCYDVRYDSGIGSFTIDLQDEWELASNKFDITTLKPFDKVLVRDGAGLWRPNLFGKDMITGYRYFTAAGSYKNCIPYEGNEHLLGTNNDCDEYYKTWEQ